MSSTFASYLELWIAHGNTPQSLEKRLDAELVELLGEGDAPREPDPLLNVLLRDLDLGKGPAEDCQLPVEPILLLHRVRQVEVAVRQVGLDGQLVRTPVHKLVEDLGHDRELLDHEKDGFDVSVDLETRVAVAEQLQGLDEGGVDFGPLLELLIVTVE